MAEKPSKSKLKRKKVSVEDPQLKKCLGGTQKRTHTSISEAERSAVPAAVWWNGEQLPAVESLWALTLKSALPQLQNQNWDLVPDLPEPSAVTTTALKEDDLRCCDLRDEIPPFPEPSSRIQSGPLRSSSSQQDPPVQTKPAPDLDPQLSSQSRTSLDIKRRSLQAKRQSSVGGNMSLSNQQEVSDCTDLMQEVQNKEEMKRSDRGAGGRVLQSCPMCLLEFPVGFTQMDCDSHLAQCLSEVNEDVTW
ncbi:Fanconi anemia core complex-associated protein 20 [Xyrichtys novacula]|uniref:Fanconi anemia core complex-associated protein 20 n=1 Tax=Xyrichtys novacula TaxID=13765 RepID=A0AAV1F2H2_XYRNO|nr:Fanconi anemia core complex-associated protein 20 [Xyrichtys novacula]